MKILMGSYNEQAPPKVTAAGISYWAFDLDNYGPKRINKKAVNRLTRAGVSPEIIATFREWALRLPAELSDWIDTAWQGRIDAWRACVGQRLPNGAEITASKLNSITPQSFKIIFHPEPFLVVQGVKAAGAAWADRIEVVIAYLDANNTWLRKCDDLLAWEFGNCLGIRHGFSPQDPTQEIGSKTPCA